MTRKLLKKPKTTEEIERVALSLGASMGAIYQWRRRGTPPAWKIKIVAASKNRIKFTDFQD